MTYMVYGCTPLAWAADYGYSEVVRCMCESGADRGLKDEDGQTPLLRVAFRGKMETVKRLCKHGANEGATDNEGKTALLWAVRNDNLPTAKLFVSRRLTRRLRT